VVEAEGWKLAAAITKSYFEQAMPFIWDKLVENFEKVIMDDGNKKYVDATLRFAEAYAIMIQQQLQQDEEEKNKDLEKVNSLYKEGKREKELILFHCMIVRRVVDKNDRKVSSGCVKSFIIKCESGCL
jgi:hypothetical protein